MSTEVVGMTVFHQLVKSATLKKTRYWYRLMNSVQLSTQLSSYVGTCLPYPHQWWSTSARLNDVTAIDRWTTVETNTLKTYVILTDIPAAVMAPNLPLLVHTVLRSTTPLADLNFSQGNDKLFRSFLCHFMNQVSMP